MDYSINFLPIILVWITAMLATVLILVVGGRVHWLQVWQSGNIQVWFVSIFILAITWMIRATTDSGLSVHLLGSMLFTLMFGWRMGILGMSLVCVLVSLWGNIPVVNLPVTILIQAFIAVTFCYLVFLLIEYFLPRNLYIYLYLSAFFGAALSFCFTGTLSAVIFWLSGVEDWSTLGSYYLPFVYLMSFAEAFVTCGLLTVFVVYRPKWVFSFRDERYLNQ